MNPITIRIVFFGLFSSIFYLQAASAFAYGPAPALGPATVEYDVYVVNNLPENRHPLKVHCQSSDIDVGERVLRVNESFKWHAPPSWRFLHGFDCAFNWNKRYHMLSALNPSIAEDYCGWDGEVSVCYWSVQDSGFYFANVSSPPKKALKKLVDW